MEKKMETAMVENEMDIKWNQMEYATKTWVL